MNVIGVARFLNTVYNRYIDYIAPVAPHTIRDLLVPNSRTVRPFVNTPCNFETFKNTSYVLSNTVSVQSCSIHTNKFAHLFRAKQLLMISHRTDKSIHVVFWRIFLVRSVNKPSEWWWQNCCVVNFIFSMLLSRIFSKLIHVLSWLDAKLLCPKFRTIITRLHWTAAICFGGYFLLGHSVVGSLEALFV